jgi:predicted NodU family carbamoyl transferase
VTGSILGFNLGHDGAVALLKDQSLAFSYEREKDSRPRHSHMSFDLIFEAIQAAGELPSIVAVGGWSTRGGSGNLLLGGYHGIEGATAVNEIELFGNRVTLFQSTHERSHIFCSYGLSPLEQGQPCYVLVWEGDIGAFYEIDPNFKIVKVGTPVNAPGYKYSFAFDLANPEYRMGAYRLDSAGKLMALASYSSRSSATPIEKRAIEQILAEVTPPWTDKSTFAWSPYLNCGVMDSAFTDFAGKLSDAIFDSYFGFARDNLRKGYPLLIGGGCGLNCEWNSRWRDSGLFDSVFVPPIANDSGSAIGTAIEAQYELAGTAKLKWNVYAGLEFGWDQQPAEFEVKDLDLAWLANFLATGRVVAWVQGRCEIGPRALGNRSLLAAPFDKQMTDRLNWIKERESFRPVAPVCLEEDGAELFGVIGASPHMLYLYETKVSSLHAVTHVDGSTRIQTVSQSQNRILYKLLQEFKSVTGFGVLCNTSLNFPGKGFINRSSDLFKYVLSRKIEAAVVDDKIYIPKSLAEAKY